MAFLQGREMTRAAIRAGGRDRARAGRAAFKVRARHGRRRFEGFSQGEFDGFLSRALRQACLAATRTKVLGAASAALLVGLMYVLGGLAVAVRLMYSGGGLPLEGGLAVVPRDTLLLVGIRDFVEVVLAGGFLVYCATGARRFVLALVGLAIIAPFSAAGLSWVAALIVVRGALAWRYDPDRPEASRAIPDDRLIKLTVVVTLAAVTVVMLRYTDPPNRFPAAQVLEVPHGLPDRPPCGSHHAGLHAVCLTGLYLGSTSDTIYMARQVEIVDVPKSDVLELRLFKTEGQPRSSLIGFVSRLAGLSSLAPALTPLAISIGGRPYLYGLFG